MSPAASARLRAARAALAAAALAAAFALHAAPLSLVPELKPGAGKSVDAPTQEFNRGMQALADGDLDVAEAAFRRSLSLRPSYDLPLLGLAEVSLLRKRPDEARARLADAAKAAPDSVNVMVAQGRLLNSQRDYAAAERAYRRAIAADPKAFTPRIDLADLYMDSLRQPAKAVPLYRDAVAVRPDHAGARFGLGMALLATGQTDAARVELERSAQLAPDNPLPTLALARLHRDAGRADRALAHYDRVLKLQPGLAVALLERGDLYAARGEDRKALADYAAVTKADPKLRAAHLKTGMVHQKNGRVAEAERAYRLAVGDDMDGALAYNNLAWMAAERRANLDAALGWAQKAVALQPKVGDFHDTLAWVRRARGDLAGALASAEKAASLSPAPSIQYRLGVIRSERGDAAGAVAAFRKSLVAGQPFPERADAERRLARLEQRS